MAISKMRPMHVGKGKTIAQCLQDSIDYIKNPEKTNSGDLVTSYGCNASIADAEFLFSKRQYETITGRTQKNDVIAYHMWQSFKPGDITPEEANRLAYDLAIKFTKGKHAFVVATHTDHEHIHSHIIFNSTSIDCNKKFRNFWGSSKALRRLNDRICLENGYPIIENPMQGNHSYGKWLGGQQKLSQRDHLCLIMDDVLGEKPKDYEDFLRRMKARGYTYKEGASPGFLQDGHDRSMRLRSLGGQYSKEQIELVLSGKKQHTLFQKKVKSDSLHPEKKVNLLIDIQAKLQEGKGVGYERWAKVFNLKQMAQTFNYLSENNLLDYEKLSEKSNALKEECNRLHTKIKAAEKEMAEIAVLKQHIIHYSKTRDTYVAYRKSGYSKKFLADHESDIILHKAAKKYFDEQGLKKLPTVKSLSAQYTALQKEKKTSYSVYKKLRTEMQEAITAKTNVEHILNIEKEDQLKRNQQKQR